MQSVHLMGEGYEPHVVQEGGNWSTHSLSIRDLSPMNLHLRLSGKILMSC